MPHLVVCASDNGYYSLLRSLTIIFVFFLYSFCLYALTSLFLFYKISL